jgi:hypothetical protein
MDISEEERALINAVKDLRRLGLSFRQVAVKLRISKSRAHRLDRRWYQMLEGDIAARIKDEIDEDEWDDEELEDEAEDEGYLRQTGELESPADKPASLPEPRPRPVATGPWQGPEPCPFMYDKSDAAKRWLKFLASRHPDKQYSEIRRAYVNGDEWARPPGSKPPIDPKDPFAGMEVDVDVRGNIKYVVERDINEQPSVWYAYKPNGRLHQYYATGIGALSKPANANLFGRSAHIGKEAPGKDAEHAKRCSRGSSGLQLSE